MSTIHWPFAWALLFFAIVAVECFALGTGHAEYTLSYTVRLVRFDPIGRFVVLILWSWLTVHFVIAPKWVGTHPEWRNLLAVAIGLSIAIWETVK